MVRLPWRSRVSRAWRCHRVGAMRPAEHDKSLRCELRATGTTIDNGRQRGVCGECVRESSVNSSHWSVQKTSMARGVVKCCEVHHEVGKRARTGESAGMTKMQPARTRCCGESTKYTIEHCWHVVAADCTSGRVRVTVVQVVHMLQFLIWYMLCAIRKRPLNNSCRQLLAHGDSHNAFGQMTIVKRTIICGRDDAKLAEIDTLESMDVCEEVCEDAFSPHDHVISCRCVVAE